MSNIPITPGSGVSSVATETISGIDYQKVKIVGGEAGSTSVMGVAPDGSIKVSVLGNLTVSIAATSSMLGASVIGSVPVKGVASVGSAVSIFPVVVGGSDSSGNVKTLNTAPDGDLRVQLHSSLP